MRITMSRMILLSGLLHLGMVGAAATAKFTAAPRTPPLAFQVKLVKRADAPRVMMARAREEPPPKKPPAPALREKAAPIVQARKEVPTETKKPEISPVPREVRVDMTLAMARPDPKPRAQSPARPSAAGRARAADIDMNLEIPLEARPSPGSGGGAAGAARGPAVAQPNAGAGYLAMAMDVTTGKAARPGAGPARNPGVSTGNSLLGFTGRAHAATWDGMGMNLDIQRGGGKGGNGPVPGQGTGSTRGSKPGRLLASGGAGLGNIEISTGLIPGEGSGRPSATAGHGPGGQGTPAPRMIVRQAAGQIPLGAPLSFKLAAVGDETVSGSAYLSRSAQLKKFLDTRPLPGAPVTIPVPDGSAPAFPGLVGVSCSSTQIVLQFANGKQQVVALDPGEPYPRFELRLASAGGRDLSVGTKLEEITACLQTLQQVLKE